MREKYEKILFYPHHTPTSRARMSELERAAQFAPFAALSGFEEEVFEEARLTERRITLDEHEIERLNLDLQRASQPGAAAEVVITYFVRDKRKSGGAYVSKKGRIKEIDTYGRRVNFLDGASVDISSIVEIEIL